MKQQIRRGVFETNSSSVHTVTMCSQVEFDAWKEGELVYDRFEHSLITVDKKEVILLENKYGDEYRFYTYDEFFESLSDEFETFNSEYTTPLGEVVHAFGYFGYDG